jgi:hypothetical protein
MEVRMRWVEEDVSFLRHHGRRDHQDRRGARARPGGPEVCELVGGWIGTPVPGERGRCAFPPRDVVGDVCRDDDQVGRCVGRIQVDEAFEDGEREGGGRVDDRHAPMVPAAAGLPGALAVEGGVRTAADPPDARQL